jgi:hypothetical protein
MSTGHSLAPKSGTTRHRCFELADEQLRAKNTELVEKFEFPSGRARLCIQTRKINARIRTGPIVMVANYCPFCGEKLYEESSAPEATAARPRTPV